MFIENIDIKASEMLEKGCNAQKSKQKELETFNCKTVRKNG